MLFSSFPLRGLTLRNRIGVSPMCQYNSTDGFANTWHLVHLGSRAVGGAGMIITEAAAVEPRGRITPRDLGIWSDAHVEKLSEITAFLKSHGAAPVIQLAHAGRKASCAPPDQGGAVLAPDAPGGWQTVAPSAVAFREGDPLPTALSTSEIAGLVESFAAAARRSVAAGFDAIEIHAAHGYLLHQFLSPLANRRDDNYGGSFENRTRFLLEVAAAIRGSIPDAMPLLVRISATDWVEGGWTLDESVELSRALKAAGVDLMDCSSGAMVPYAKIPAAPGYQVPFADRIRREAGIATATVGLITSGPQAEEILTAGKADVVLIGREFLRDAYWPYHAARALGETISAPVPYQRGW